MPGCAMTGGFTGKLPARGDFVRAGLPRHFTDPWDTWWSHSLACVQQSGDWKAAWLEAPVWRFHLGAGACGPESALGLWMPSVDRVGRYFPLTLAAVGPVGAPSNGLLDTLEQAGRAAVASGLVPDALTRLVDAALATELGGEVPDGLEGQSCWWTAGAPRVPAARFGCAGLPDVAAFAAMLDAGR